MSAPLATLTTADTLGLLVAAAVCAFLLYALLRGENL
jgi:F subunit of K+-transporting ATPase (Potass_KdpF)